MESFIFFLFQAVIVACWILFIIGKRILFTPTVPLAALFCFFDVERIMSRDTSTEQAVLSGIFVFVFILLGCVTGYIKQKQCKEKTKQS